MRWKWNPKKAADNKKPPPQGHGVSFELAERVFGDPLAITVPDPYPHEERWRTIGMPSAESPVVLFVVHTWPDDDDGVGRIISARRAEPHERRAYEEGKF